MRTGWADGPEFVTQCPIRPGKSYTYRFTIQGQEGTLWWHAHSSWLRATVYGALIIHPAPGSSFPFPKPDRQTALVLGICRAKPEQFCPRATYFVKFSNVLNKKWQFSLYQGNGGMQIRLM